MNSASCARPGCAIAPAAWLAYDYEARCAWLDDQPDDEKGNVSRWPLCERHADTLRVPRGWFCVDRRGSRVVAEPEPPDASNSESQTAGKAARPKRPASRTSSSGGRLTAIL